jgi:5-methylcytosine-specific restriction endonuclease McrA
MALNPDTNLPSPGLRSREVPSRGSKPSGIQASHSPSGGTQAGVLTATAHLDNSGHNPPSAERDSSAGAVCVSVNLSQVLVLNASYEPLNITTWKRAVVMVLMGKAEGLEHDRRRQLRPNLHQPTVIRLRQFVRVPYRQMPLTRRNVFQRDDHRCQYCGTGSETLSIDHVVPRSRGGADCWENVTTACLACNVRKGNRTPREAGMPLRQEPRRPLSTLSFEARRRMGNGLNAEWEKYLIGA